WNSAVFKKFGTYTNLFLKDESGNDWYEVQKLFAPVLPHPSFGLVFFYVEWRCSRTPQVDLCFYYGNEYLFVSRLKLLIYQSVL
ncbi:hypothetical protein ACUWC4_34485, partial [Klebsiella pneumoniae]